MPIQYHSEIKGEYLHVVAEGASYSAVETLRYIAAMHEELARAGLSKLLVDETRCHTHISLDGMMALADALHKQEPFARKPMVALVSSDRDSPLFRHVFASVDKISIAATEEEARGWLLGAAD